MPEAMTATNASWVQVALALVTILGLIVREIIAFVRHRRETLERAIKDAELAAEVVDQAASVKQEAQRVAEELKRNQERDSRTIQAALIANTEITRTAASEAKAAYTEANAINAKIAAIGERFDALLIRDHVERQDERSEERTERADQIDHIQNVTDEIHDIVVEGEPEPVKRERSRA